MWEAGRIVRSSMYLEPTVREAANKAAAKRGESFSAWARKVIIEELILSGEIGQSTLRDLAVNK